jgi:glycosyltransferase involved in cell wall biosynthesis
MEPERQGHASYTHVHEIIKGLTACGWRINLYCPRHNRASLPNILQRLQGIVSTIFFAIVSNRPNVYYMRWHFATFPVFVWAQVTRTPTIIEVNGPIEDLFIAWPLARNMRGFFAWLMIYQLRSANGIVTVTDGLNELSRSLSNSTTPVFTIPNGANTDLFCPEAAYDSNIYTQKLPEHFMVFFGSMARWQGLSNVLECLEHPNWPINTHMVFIGDGIERKAVEKVTKRNAHAHYLGRIPYELLPSVIARALGSFVCSENLGGRGNTGLAPLKLFESLACGLPVITTNLPYQADVVRNADCGIVVNDARNLVQLTEAVITLRNKQKIRAKMASNARYTAVQNHSWSARAKTTDEFIRSTID